MQTLAVKRRNNGFGSTVPQSAMRQKVNKNAADIILISQKDGITPEKVAEKILRMSQDELKKYIQSKGEVPVRTWEGRSLQAALLRMEDISVLSRSMDMTEDQALAHIEEAESDAVRNNTAAKASILTPSTQGALSFVIKNVVNKMKSQNGTTGISDALDLIRVHSATPLNHNIDPGTISAASVCANCFDGSDSTDSTTDFGDTPDLSPVSVTTGLQPVTTSPSINGDSSNPNFISSVTVAPTTSSVTASGPSSDGSIWSAISSLASASGTIGGNIVSTANGLSTVLNNVGGQIGANAISDYLSKNWAYLVAGIIAIAIIIILLTRAAKS